MGLLEKVEKGKKISPPRIWVYGTPGIGKTTLGQSAASPVFICTEQDSTKEILGSDRLPLCKSFADVESQVGALLTEKHDYKTLIIDGLSGLEDLLFKKICDEHGVKTIDEVGKGFQRGQQQSADEFRDLMEGFDALRNRKKMAIMILSHAQIKNFANPYGDSYDRYLPKVNKFMGQVLQEWADIIGFANWKTYTTKKEEKFGNERTVAVGQGERSLYLEERPSHVAKTRYSHAPEISLSWDELMKGIK